MQFYVPELGDKIRLTSDWTFPLHEEGRNHDVMQLLDEAGAVAAERIRRQSIFAEIAAEMERITAPARERAALRDQQGLPYVYFLTLLTEEERAAYQAVELRRQEAHQTLTSIAVDVTLLAGTELTIDRIYIRKGSKAFSSITFFIGKTPDPRLQLKGRRRFWAKLADCNRMQYERVGIV